MEGHPAAPVRSRSSQSQSPSHSASASSSAHHKRKFVPPAPAPTPATAFSLSDTGALTSNDELESMSAREEEDDSEEMEEDEEEEEEGNESMRTFTNARVADVHNTSGRSVKPPKMEGCSGGGMLETGVKDERGGAAGTAGLMSGLVVKEDTVKGIFTENIQTSGAYSTREEGLKKEEDAGKLKFLCYSNDGVDEHMIWLIGLKNIFARQLPNMPKGYIVRLLMDRKHKSMMVVRNNQVVGGITYRPYVSQKFGEIAFCAITADEQVKGYGTRLMNHLKQHARDVDGLTHFLTFADNNAVGYFLKQGFSKEISLEKERWQGYIKDYDGVILMECKIDQKLPYTDLSTMIRRQRQKEAGIPKKLIKVEDIPGLREAGWTPDQWGHSRFKNSNTDNATFRQSLNTFIRMLLKMMNEHPDAWPFREPVDARDVPDYYDIIKDPMDLKTMSKRLESDQYYVTFEMFVADVKRMFANARTYNSPETIYYKCATRLETHFSNKVHGELSNMAKFSHNSRSMHIQ